MIRRAAPDDVEAIVAIYQAAKAAQPDVLRDLHTAEEHRAFFGAAVRDHEVWVAGDESGLVGFAFLKGDLLSHIFVLPVSQGRGVGKALLDKTKERLPDGFTLWTHQPNVQARRFYERHGLRPVEFGDGSENEEGVPDVRYEWKPSA